MLGPMPSSAATRTSRKPSTGTKTDPSYTAWATFCSTTFRPIRRCGPPGGKGIQSVTPVLVLRTNLVPSISHLTRAKPALLRCASTAISKNEPSTSAVRMSPDPYHGRGEPRELTASGFPTLAGVLIPSARGGSQFNACREKKLRPGLEPRRRSKEKHEPASRIGQGRDSCAEPAGFAGSEASWEGLGTDVSPQKALKDRSLV